MENRRNWFKKAAIVLAGIGLFKSKALASNVDVSGSMGAFSVSLNVKDLAASKAFYENLGFTVFGGDMKKKYLIMKNGNTLIGIFQGMFEKTLLTFNPGWDENAKNIDKFEDIRDIQKRLQNKGVKLSLTADEKTKGPASVMLEDPDGNQILIDQHR
jgi:catechol 2,3-dioxygenase-like lactoylglutathione lyase family enzyme